MQNLNDKSSQSAKPVWAGMQDKTCEYTDKYKVPKFKTEDTELVESDKMVLFWIGQNYIDLQ